MSGREDVFAAYREQFGRVYSPEEIQQRRQLEARLRKLGLWERYKAQEEEETPPDGNPEKIRCPNCDEWTYWVGGRVWRCPDCGYQEER